MLARAIFRDHVQFGDTCDHVCGHAHVRSHVSPDMYASKVGQQKFKSSILDGELLFLYCKGQGNKSITQINISL